MSQRGAVAQREAVVVAQLLCLHLTAGSRNRGAVTLAMVQHVLAVTALAPQPFFAAASVPAFEAAQTAGVQASARTVPVLHAYRCTCIAIAQHCLLTAPWQSQALYICFSGCTAPSDALGTTQPSLQQCRFGSCPGCHAWGAWHRTSNNSCTKQFSNCYAAILHPIPQHA